MEERAANATPDGERRLALSIIIPTLNESRSIGAALDAVLGARAEVIVVDGGSADATVEIARGRGARVITS
ncbi:MAG TPA: glycosyltransferase, partial [Pyrinomonadaceae bacterium]